MVYHFFCVETLREWDARCDDHPAEGMKIAHDGRDYLVLGPPNDPVERLVCVEPCGREESNLQGPKPTGT